MKCLYFLLILIVTVKCQTSDDVMDCYRTVTSNMSIKGYYVGDNANPDEVNDVIMKKCEDTIFGLNDGTFTKREVIKRAVSPDQGDVIADRIISVWDQICSKGYNNGQCTDDSAYGDNNGDHGTYYKSGCYNGYCWAGCFGGCKCISGVIKEWCYTGSRGFGYKTCTQDSDCPVTLPCAGTCSI